MTIAIRHFSSEQVLGDLHPKLLSCLATVRLISVISSHHSVIYLKCLFYSLRVKIQDAIKDDLSSLNLLNTVDQVQLVAVIKRLFLLSLEMLNFALADIDRIIHLEEDRLALTLVCFFTLQMLDQVIKIIPMHKHVECHIMHRFSRRSFQLNTILCQIVSGFFIGPIWYLMEGGDERLEWNVAEFVGSKGFKGFLGDLF